MTKIAPNMGKEFCENPPYIANCKYCGAEAFIHGKPDWEWWTHEIGCSAYCHQSKRFQRYGVKELIEMWNKENDTTAGEG